jgi:transposase
MDILHVGLDLSRRRLDVCVMDVWGGVCEELQAFPDRDGLARLAAKLAGPGSSVRAVIESMTGARFVHDQLELAGWDVEVADAHKVKGLAPLACKTDRIDARVLAELSRRDLVPAIWLPTPGVRAGRERARWRLHLVKHRTALKNRIHSTLMTWGVPCPVSDLFGSAGRDLLDRLALPEPWSTDVRSALTVVDHLDDEIDACAEALRADGAEHRYVPLLRTIPGVSWVLAYTIAVEIGDIERFASPRKLCSYSGLCPRVEQSGERDRRGSLTKHGPRYLRWALIEAVTHAARHPAYTEVYTRTKSRLGRQRGPKVARIEVARRLAEAIWYMLTRNEPFNPHVVHAA